MVPVELEKAAKAFARSLLEETRVHVEADADADGIASAIILRDALRAKGIDVSAETLAREEAHPVDAALVLADLAIRRGTPTWSAVQGSPVAYAVDHHRWDEGARLRATLNPYHVSGLPVEPHRISTGLLAFLAFRDAVPHLGWLALAAAIADHNHHPLAEEIAGTRRTGEIETVARILGSVSIHPDVDVREIPDFIGSPSSPADILHREDIMSLHQQATAEIARLTQNPAERAIVYDRRNRVMVIPVDSRYRRAKSIVSTIVSDRYPDWIVVAVQRKGDALKASIRFQNAEKHGMDMGKVAKRIAAELMGNGGGHPPAAGITLPRTVTVDDLVAALYRALGRYP